VPAADLAIWRNDEYVLSFLFGRRITPGNRINNELLFINLASVTGRRFSNTATSPSRTVTSHFLRHFKLISFIIFAVCFGCKSKTRVSSLTLDKILNDTSARIILTDTSNGLTQLRDVGTDTVVGGYYEFYKNGKLKSYDFFFDRKEDTSQEFMKKYGDSIISLSAYGEYYDTTGKLKSVKYNPFVYSLIRIKKNCIVNFKLYFFSLDKEYQRINVTTSNDKKYQLQLLPDTVFTNMKFVTFDIDGQGLDSIYAFVSAEYKNLNWGTNEILTDTVPIQICSKK
jgi:hypothetical protein